VKFNPSNSTGDRITKATALVVVTNQYPLALAVPPLEFELLVSNCIASDPFINVAIAGTDSASIRPFEDIRINVTASISRLPDDLTKLCPNSRSSPLDLLLRSYVQGEKTTVYVRGSTDKSSNTPDWMRDLLKSVTVPIPLPHKDMDNLIRNFSLTDVDFTLPDLSDPDGSSSKVKISAVVNALVGLPKEATFALNITRVRADADVFYHGRKLGELDLDKWQSANSSHVDAGDPEIVGLLIQSKVQDAPLTITDNDLLSEIIQQLVLEHTEVDLQIKARVDVQVETDFGSPIIKDIPAAGNIKVKRMY
jgi:hypothetical protein